MGEKFSIDNEGGIFYFSSVQFQIWRLPYYTVFTRANKIC